MMITTALALSPVEVAYRYDDEGHIWLYKANKSYIMVETNMRDNAGEPTYAEYECKLVEDYNNWEPYEEPQYARRDQDEHEQ